MPQGLVYVIDVSQSVEHDHPNALLFLRKDCENAIHFFRKHGVANVPSLQPLFDFVVDPTIKVADIEAAYDRLCTATEAAEPAAAASGASGEPGSGGPGDLPADTEAAAAATAAARAEAQVAEAVFAQMHIPRTMEELAICDIERDLAIAAAGSRRRSQQ